MQLELGSSPRKASRPTRKPQRHHWNKSSRALPSIRKASTAFDVALQLLCPHDRINDAGAALLEGRIPPETIRSWRRSKSKAPVWAIDTLVRHLRHKGEEMLAAASELSAELEKEKGAR